MAGGTEVFRAFGTLALREVGDIQGRLNSVGRSATTTGGSISKLSTFLGVVGIAAAGAATVIGGAVVGGLTIATKKSDEFKDALGNLKTDTNTADKDTKALGQTLKNVYKAGYGKDINDTAEAIKSVSQETKAGGKELERYTKKLVTLSDKMGTEYNDTMKTAKIMSEEFGISIDEAFELMAQGNAKGLNSSGDMLDVLSEYSVQYAKNGNSAEDFISTLIAGNEEGVYSYDKLADMQKEFSIRAIDGSKSTMEAFDNLGLSYSEYSKKLAEGGEVGKQAQQEILESLLEIEDPIERNKIGVALLGTQYEDLGDSAVEALANTDQAVDKTGNKMEELNQTRFDTLTEQFKVIDRKFETNVLLPIGEKLAPVISSALDEFTRFASESQVKLGEVRTFILNIWEAFKADDTKALKEQIGNLFPEDLKDNVDSYIESIMSFKTTLGEIGEFITGVFKPQFDELKSTWEGLDFSAASEALDKLSKTFSENLLPVIKIVAGVIGGVLGVAFSLVLSVINAVLSAVPSLTATILSLYNIIINTFSLLIETIVALFTGDFSKVGKIFGDLVDSIIGFLSNLGQTAIDLVMGLVDGLISAFIGLWDTLVGHSIIPDMVNSIIDWFKKLPGKLLEIAQNILSKVTTKFNEIKTAAVNKISELVQMARNKFNEIVSKLNTVMSNLKSNILEKWTSIKNVISQKIEEIKTSAKSKFESIKSTISTVIESLKTSIRGKFNDIKGFIQPVVNKFNDVKDAVQGVINKISNLKMPSLPDWVPGFAAGVRDFAGGLSLVGERGAELTYLPSGSNVYNSRETKNILNNLAKPATSSLITPQVIGGTAETKIFNIKMQINPNSIKDLNDFMDLIEGLGNERTARETY